MEPEFGRKAMIRDKAGDAEHQFREYMMKKRVEGQTTAEIRYTNMEMYQIGTLCSHTRRGGGSPV